MKNRDDTTAHSKSVEHKQEYEKQHKLVDKNNKEKDWKLLSFCFYCISKWAYSMVDNWHIDEYIKVLLR